MNNSNIKQEIIELCHDMIIFWDRLQREIMKIPNQNKDDIVLKWKSYFPENHDVISKLILTKMNIESLERELIESGVLRYKEQNNDFKR